MVQGKTTLIRILTGIIIPDSGQILINEQPINKLNIKKIGYLPEERGLYKKMRVGEQAIYLAVLKGLSNQEAEKKLKQWFERLVISDWWDKKVETLSKGMQQKIQFIISVIHQPDLLILDEPFSGLDPINREVLGNEILELNKSGMTIILSTHDMNSVEQFCDQVVLLDKGAVLLSGKVNEIKQARKSILLSSIFLLPSYLAKQHEDYKQLEIGLVSSTPLLKDAFNESELVIKWLGYQTIDDINKLILSNQFEGIIHVNSDSIGTDIQYFSTKQPSVFLQNQIKTGIQKVIINEKLSVYGIDDVDKIIRSAKESIAIESIKLGTKHTQTLITPYQRSLCMALGVTIYLFIFLFSSQVMRGVLEEKSNKIVELIITSISPVKFMAGKIIGIALLG